MKTRQIILLTAISLAALAACKSKFELLLSSNDVQAKYDEAWNLYNTQKYKKAASLFESLSMLTSGTEKDDTVRFYWAMSNYKYKDYVTATANFDSFIELYPRSPFTEQARFLKLDCLYRSTYRYELDQGPTNLALVSISEFLAEFPDTDKKNVCIMMSQDLSKRLDKKAFENARLYYKMEDYIAARTSFRNVLKDDSDNIYREEILYYTAKSSYKYAALSVPSKQKERYMEFTDDYFNFIGEYPESTYRKDLDQLYERSQRAVKGQLTKEDRKAEKKSAKAVGDTKAKADETVETGI